MSWQFLLHRCDVDDPSIQGVSAGPGVEQFVLFPLLLLVLVPLDPSGEESVEYLVDLHLFPLGGHEVAFGGGVGVDWEGVVVVVADFIVGSGDGLAGHFAAADAVDEFELLVGEADVALVEFVADGPPPVLVLRLLDELRDLVVLLLLGDLLQVLVVAEVLELIVPSVGDLPDLHFGQLVLLVEGLIVAIDCVRKRTLLPLPLQCTRSSSLLHPSPIIIVIDCHPNIALQQTTTLQALLYTPQFQLHHSNTKTLAVRGDGLFNNIILLMESNRNDRQRRIDNVQKELMTNYYLQKYNSFMSEITKQPEPPAEQFHTKPREKESNRLNFKNMILLKKNENQNNYHSRTHHISPPNPPLKDVKGEIKHRLSGKEEQENQRVAKRLEESIINELYKPSPSRLEEGSYKKLEINSSRYRDVSIKKFELEPIPTENIEITYQEEGANSDSNHQQENAEREAEINEIKEAIKQEFQRRKDKSSSPKRNSPKKNSPKKRENSENSSRISLQIKIQSPKLSERVLTPNRYKSKNSNKRIQSEAKLREGSAKSHKDQQTEEDMNHYSFAQPPQIHFSREFVEPIQPHEEHHRIEEEQIVEEDIQFMPPTSNYYKSDNNNLVEESIQYQQKISQKDNHSERDRSMHSSEKNEPQKQSLDRQSSKKSIRSGQKTKSELKESSNFEMSFVSRMSMLSSEEGQHIKETIEKELYENELGPYQSALYGLLDLMAEFPKSGPIYAVGQRTLEDRKAYEQRRLLQEKEMADYRKKMQKLRLKSQVRPLQGEEQEMRQNKLQILRMVRRISTKL